MDLPKQLAVYQQLLDKGVLTRVSSEEIRVKQKLHELAVESAMYTVNPKIIVPANSNRNATAAIQHSEQVSENMKQYLDLMIKYNDDLITTVFEKPITGSASNATGDWLNTCEYIGTGYVGTGLGDDDSASLIHNHFQRNLHGLVAPKKRRKPRKKKEPVSLEAFPTGGRRIVLE